MAVVFEISGDYAMFRKFYTTTSSVSYPFPPPSAVGGMICAIIGETNNSENAAHLADYWNVLYGNRIAISVLSQTKWYTASVNFWNFKDPKKAIHNIIKHQFVKNPRYRIYVEGPLEERLLPFLETGSFVFTPYLGTAYAFANITYIGSFESTPVDDGTISIRSIIPLECKPKIDFVKTGGVFKDIVPFQMDAERTLEKSITVFYPSDFSKGTYVENPKEIGAVRVGDDTIVFLPRWEEEPS